MATDAETERSLILGGRLDVQAAADVPADRPSVPVEALAYPGIVFDWPPLGGDTVLDLAGLESPNELPLLINHQNEVGGQAGMVSPVNDGRTLIAKGTIATETAAGREVMVGHHGGNKYQASMRFTPLRLERVAAGQVVNVNGRDVTAGERGLSIVRKARLREITVVPVGQVLNTRVDIAASLAGESGMNENSTLAVDVDDPTYNRRLGAAKATIARTSPDRAELVEYRALHEGWSLDQIDKEVKLAAERSELHTMRESMPRSPLRAMVGSAGDGERPSDFLVAECALAVNAGASDEDLRLSYSDDVVDAAMGAQWRGFGLQAACQRAIRAAGKSIGPGGFSPATIALAAEADRDVRLAGMSSYSVSGITSNVANKAALAGFNSVERTWRRVCSVDSVSNFKEQSFFRLTSGAKYKQIGPGESMGSASLGEEGFVNQAQTYGILLQVDRTTLINDDLGMLRQGARLNLGVAAGRTMNELIWSKLVSSDAVGSGKFFHTSHPDRGPNYAAGPDTALDAPSLEVAYRMLQSQVDSDGDPLDIDPAFLLTSPELAFEARAWCKDPEVREPTGTKKGTTRNSMVGLLEPLVSRYLNSANVDGGSATAWYLMANPNALGVGAIQVVFLNGRRTPAIESSETDFDTLGIKMRGYFDFGVKLQEKACAVKMKGVN